MSILQGWVDSPAARALGWTLFHSLWQGALAALALAAVLPATRSARVRYAAACLAMLGVLAAFVLTFAAWMARERAALPRHSVNSTQARARASAPIRAEEDPMESPALRLAKDFLPWLAPFWTAGVILLHLRHLASWLAARRLRRTGVCCASALWQDRLARLAAQMRLSRPVALLESCLAEVPVVMGHLRPVVLVPVGLLAGLPAGQMEAILLHELAHIRRADYLVNLLQTFVESILFYHPAVWWISKIIHAERENCCDDLVVASSGDAHTYALALAALEQNRAAVWETALAATGGSLVKRIRRLLYQPEGPRAGLAPVFSAAILTVTAALALRAWQSPPLQPLPLRPAPLADLSTPYLRWLNIDVAYIINDRERAAFLNLKTDEEREHFIEQFWLRRDPTPGTEENEAKMEHYRRIAYTGSRYTTSAAEGWTTDRARIYIVYGPPDEIESHPFGSDSDYPFEDWRYRHIDGLGDYVIFEFVDQTWSGDYRLTTNPSDKHAPAGIPHAGGPSIRIDATVQVANGAARISIPMDSYADHHVKLVGRLATADGRGRGAFEDGVQGPAPVYTKLVELRPGSYRLKLKIRDVTTGVTGEQDIEFEVK